MKFYFHFIFLLCVSSLAFSQSTGPFAIWEDQANSVYKFVHIDAATGVKTNINTLTGVTAFVLGGKSAIDPRNNYYHFAGLNGANTRFYTVDIATGNIIYNPLMTDNVVGIEYNYNDSTLYGILVNGNTYTFCSIDPVTAQATIIGTNLNITGYVAGSFALDISKNEYSFKSLTVNGYYLRTINVQTGATLHNNPFPDNVVGFRYNCLDSTIYGLWDVNNVYTLEKINPTTGTHTTVDTLAGVTPGYVSESHSMNEAGIYTFRGFNGSNFAIISVDVSNASVVAINNTSDNASGFEEPTCSSLMSAGDINTDDSFIVYPNPSRDGKFQVTSHKSQVKSAVVFSLIGDKILDLTIQPSNHLTVDLAAEPGIYFIRMTDESGGMAVKKIIVQ
jgi:hypothetical protein